MQAKNFLLRNKELILIVLILLLGFYTINNLRVNYHRKQVEVLEARVKAREKDFQKVIEEKVRLQDSSIYYEQVAREAGNEAQRFKAQAEKFKKEKDKALKALDNITKKAIDSFLAERYRDVPKSDTTLNIDKNVGSKIAVELLEKDYLVLELDSRHRQTAALDSQVFSLNTSLVYSKAALVQADSAITVKTEQLNLTAEANGLLKEDLKVAKRKNFWNKWKAGGVGIAVGILLTVLLL